jgi:virulence-associated protein VagC
MQFKAIIRMIALRHDISSDIYYIAQITKQMKDASMRTARLFINGRSQAVRLSREYRFSGTEVYVKKLQGVVMLIPKDDPWALLVHFLCHIRCFLFV